MDIKHILTQLRDERDRLDRAIAALNGTVARRGRPASSNTAQTRRGRRGGARHMSPAARKRISQMMKQRWAARKKAGKSRL